MQIWYGFFDSSLIITWNGIVSFPVLQKKKQKKKTEKGPKVEKQNVFLNVHISALLVRVYSTQIYLLAALAKAS